MATAERNEIIDPKRVKTFAKFFKNYMSISTLVVAALPIPVTQLGVIPTFHAHTKLLSTFTSLFCFLLLGYIFYCRHGLARIMFPEYFAKEEINPFAQKMGTGIRLLPLFLIIALLGCTIQYFRYLEVALTILASMSISATTKTPAEYSTYLLKETSLGDIPVSAQLILYYLGIFIAAEAAFILMALKEYLQDLIGLSEMALIRGPQRKGSVDS